MTRAEPIEDDRPEVSVNRNGPYLTIVVSGGGVTHTYQHTDTLSSSRRAEMDAARVKIAIGYWRTMKGAVDAV